METGSGVGGVEETASYTEPGQQLPPGHDSWERAVPGDREGLSFKVGDVRSMPRLLPGTWHGGHGTLVSTEGKTAGVEIKGPLGSQVSRNSVLPGPDTPCSACVGPGLEPRLPMHHEWRAPLAVLDVLVTGDVCSSLGFPGGTGGKEHSCQCRRRKRRGFDVLTPRLGRSPGGESHGQRSLCATARGVTKSRTRLT